jgi:hypothetical protein
MFLWLILDHFSASNSPGVLIVPYYRRSQSRNLRAEKNFQFPDFCSVFVRVFNHILPIEVFAAVLSKFCNSNDCRDARIGENNG